MSETTVRGVKGVLETYVIKGREYPITLINMYDVDELLASKFKDSDVVEETSFGWRWVDIVKMEAAFRSWIKTTNAHL